MKTLPAELPRIAMHHGVSFTPGTNVVHFWIASADEGLLRRRWNSLLGEYGLAGPLTLRPWKQSGIHGCASAFIFLPVALVQGVIAGSYRDHGWEPRGARDAELISQLELSALDCSAHSRSYEWHYRIAQFRRWVAMPLQLGRSPSLFLGTGRYSRLLIMNVDQSAGAPLSFVGSDKSYCRNFLTAHGFPVAPGATAFTPSEAVARAREIGFPVALKKSQASGNSEGVILGIDNERDCTDAAQELLAGSQILLIEKMIEGIELRLHFIHGRLFRILRSEALTVTGDGSTTLENLLREKAPAYFETMSRTEHHRRRLVLQVYRLGVRQFSDLAIVTPAAGQAVRVSAAAGGPHMARMEIDAIHPDDLRALESMFARYGSPGAGVDLIIPRLGARLNEGGAILEMNIPCGFGYLGDEAARAADREVLEAVRRSPGFIASGSRVPLEIAASEDFPEGSDARAALIDRFSRRHKGARIASLSPASGWIPILTDPDASAFLVFVTEAAIEEHGMPVNLQPAVRVSREWREFQRLYPLLCDTAANAGGTFIGRRKSGSSTSLGSLIVRGETQKATAYCRRELRGEMKSDARSALLLCLHYFSGFSPEQIHREHVRFAGLYEKPLLPPGPPYLNRLDPDRPLRVGYVSSDYRQHATNRFLQPLLRNHDPGAVSVFCYSAAPSSDSVTAGFQQIAGANWRDISCTSDEDAARKIRDDQIDILVDLNGQTPGNRLTLFARRPAPLQATWLGYPATTGLQSIDFRITDAHADPPGTTEHLHSEKLFRLPCFLCYEIAEDLPDTSPLPMDTNGFVTFGSFNNFMKISEQTVAVWSRILDAVKGSKLLLKHLHSADPEVTKAVLRRFGGRNVEIAPMTPSHAEHLASYRLVDIGLDPFPYNGTTTTCEAMSMGVPVLTMNGRTHVSRVGVTLLNQVSLTDWIAGSADDYVKRASEYARSPELLRELRQCLRRRIAESDFGRPDLFARSLESAYRQIWRQFCAVNRATETDGSIYPVMEAARRSYA